LLELDFPDPRLEDVRAESGLFVERLLVDFEFAFEDLEGLDFVGCLENRDGGGCTGCRQVYMYSPSTYWASLEYALRFTRLT
jgi:hypothetical protein